MFIITIPIQTQAVKIDLPQESEQTNPPPVDPIKNKLAIDASGVITWNGTPIDLVTTRQYLDRTAQMVPEPELQFQPAAQTRYVIVDQVFAEIKRSGVTKLGFVGNEQHASLCRLTGWNIGREYYSENMSPYGKKPVVAAPFTKQTLIIL